MQLLIQGWKQLILGNSSFSDYIFVEEEMKMFEAALCELMDAMVSAGISNLEATELIGSLLTTIMSPEEI